MTEAERRRMIEDELNSSFQDVIEREQDNLEMDAESGESDYPASLTFTSDKFIVTAFGYDREHCDDVLQCVLRGRFKDHKGDREYADCE
jgi:hypothetical protein